VELQSNSLDIITSVLNEEVCLPELYERIKNVMEAHPTYSWRLIISDNGSVDASWKIIQSLAVQDTRVLGIRMSRSFPLDSSFTCGLDLATADALVIMASDLQDPPEVIHQFLDKYEEGYEQVVAKITKRETVPFVRKVLSKIFYELANRLTKDMIPKNVSDFRLLNRPAYVAARSLRERNRFLRGLIAWTGFKTAEIEIERPPRFGGDSKFVAYKLSVILPWAFGAIFAHTTAPLIWVSVLGVFFSIVSVIATAILSLFWIFRGVPFAGFGTIVGFVCLGFSLVLLSIGVIAQYIALIYEEVKGRPIYIIAQRTDESRLH
jgi:glycosyltransferase involved in cell wall biosynthesis